MPAEASAANQAKARIRNRTITGGEPSSCSLPLLAETNRQCRRVHGKSRIEPSFQTMASESVQMNNILLDGVAYMQVYADRWSLLQRNYSPPPRLPLKPASIVIRYYDGSGKGLSPNLRAIETVGEFSIRKKPRVLSHSRNL